jgi:hypothetical protein
MNASRFLAPEDTIIIMKIKYTKIKRQSEEQNILLTRYNQPFNIYMK